VCHERDFGGFPFAPRVWVGAVCGAGQVQVAVEFEDPVVEFEQVHAEHGCDGRLVEMLERVR
jgi:hypothetical protein